MVRSASPRGSSHGGSATEPRPQAPPAPLAICRRGFRASGPGPGRRGASCVRPLPGAGSVRPATLPGSVSPATAGPCRDPSDRDRRSSRQHRHRATGLDGRRHRAVDRDPVGSRSRDRCPVRRERGINGRHNPRVLAIRPAARGAGQCKRLPVVPSHEGRGSSRSEIPPSPCVGGSAGVAGAQCDHAERVSPAVRLATAGDIPLLSVTLVTQCNPTLAPRCIRLQPVSRFNHRTGHNHPADPERTT